MFDTENLLNKHKIDIIDYWDNQLADSNMFQDKEILSNSKYLFSHILNAIQSLDIPSFDASKFKPVIQLWHNLLADYKRQGISSKDTAKLVFTLKSSVSSYITSLDVKSNVDDQFFNKLNSLLDFLSVLTFEAYSDEKDNIILNQSNQIQYLQHKAINSQYKGIIGSSPATISFLKAIGVVLNNDITVLLQGESGTGKDLVASTIHKYSTRKDKPFIVINCGAIPKDLIESELFGYEKGAFTGADKQKLGKFELANGGTLFLDEIGELSLDLQTKFLRVLENRVVDRIGSVDSIPIDVRIIAATNKNLQELVESNDFRLDLFYRLNIFPIHIPALNERGDDVLLLARHFLEKYVLEFKLDSTPIFSDDAISFLRSYSFPGNIRELENIIQKALLVSDGKLITFSNLTYTPGRQNFNALPSKPLHSEDIVSLDVLEKNAIENTLLHVSNNLQKSAKLLGISRGTLYNKIKKYSINTN